MTTAEAAAVLGISRRRCQLLVHDGRLPSTWDNDGKRVIDPTDLAAFAALPRTSGRPRRTKETTR